MKVSSLIFLFAIYAFARIPVYGPCNTANNRLKPSTKEFSSDCDVHGYCATNGTCLPRQCRKDLYVLASMRNSSYGIPPLCEAETYCPDDASGCLPLVEEGGECELNRNDQCRQPGAKNVSMDLQDLEVICLLGTCRPADIALNASCVIENTTYAGYDLSGSSFHIEVIRDDCVPGQGFCNATSNTCTALKPLEEPCQSDRECLALSCVDSICSLAVDGALHVPKWTYALVAFGTAGAMAGVLAGLIWLHKRNERTNQIKKQEYHRQQAMFELYRASSMGHISLPEKKWEQ